MGMDDSAAGVTEFVPSVGVVAVGGTNVGTAKVGVAKVGIAAGGSGILYVGTAIGPAGDAANSGTLYVGIGILAMA